jgi:hypothetical protein
VTASTIVETTKINKVDRSISTKYTDGNYRVTVRTSYFGNSKTYASSVTESRVEFNGNWETEISHLNLGFSEQRPEDDYRKDLQRVKVERYNFKELEKYHAVAVFEANDSQIVANLLAKGKTNSELYGKG